MYLCIHVPFFVRPRFVIYHDRDRPTKISFFAAVIMVSGYKDEFTAESDSRRRSTRQCLESISVVSTKSVIHMGWAV